MSYKARRKDEKNAFYGAAQSTGREKTRKCRSRSRNRRSRCLCAFFSYIAFQFSSCSLVLLFPCSTVLSHTVLRKAWPTMDMDRVWSRQQTHKLYQMPNGQWTHIENFLLRQLELNWNWTDLPATATGSPACLARTMVQWERESPCCLLD